MSRTRRIDRAKPINDKTYFFDKTDITGTANDVTGAIDKTDATIVSDETNETDGTSISDKSDATGMKITVTNAADKNADELVVSDARRYFDECMSPVSSTKSINHPIQAVHWMWQTHPMDTRHVTVEKNGKVSAWWWIMDTIDETDLTDATNETGATDTITDDNNVSSYARGGTHILWGSSPEEL